MKNQRVKFEYDTEADAAYLTLGRGKVIDSEEIEPGLVVDRDAQGKMLGVEILHFSRRFARQLKLKSSSKPKRMAG